MNLKVIITYILFLSLVKISQAQSNIDKAIEKGNQAITFENQENYDEAIKHFEDAQKLDPYKNDYPYGAAYCYLQIGNYKKAITIGTKLIQYADAGDTVYELLGNAYYNDGNEDKAVETYKTGINKFPNSGKLYFELGLMNKTKKDFNKALSYFEKGIEVDPAYPTNYYWAAKLYCNTTEEVWGMIYGELFMNVERNSKRNAEISKILYETYKSEIQFKNDTTISVSFSEQMTINADNNSDTGKTRLPYGMIYEPTLIMSLVTEKNIDLASLNRIRKGFVENYFKSSNNKKYPNVLFDYQDKIIKSGNFEAYNYWVLMKGDEEGFKSWQSANKDKWEKFMKWFDENKIILDDKHKFFRTQY